jgi:hypothetical protein
VSTAGSHAQTDVATAASRPSKNNRPAAAKGGETAKSDNRPEPIPDDGRAGRPLSVTPGERLRQECTIEREATADHTAVPWRSAVAEWRDWLRDYRKSHLEYESPEGERVRVPLENSYQPRYANRYYARFKGLERQITDEYDDLHTVMLTFTGSHRNANGGWRCPADHIREVVESWAGGVKQELHRTLRGKNWEYARILEPHQDGYGHVHMAIFVEGEVNAGDFEPVMQKHVEKCQIAGSDAHTVENAVSVNSVDPNAEEAEEGPIANLGSYLSEYLGAYGEEPDERPANVQMFYSVTWATNTRRVNFSRGASEMIREDDRERRREQTETRPEDRGGEEEIVIDAEAEEVRLPDHQGEWAAEQLVRVDRGEREEFDVSAGGIDMRTITGSPSADPPPQMG